jgi:hypothetical protein
VALWAVAVRQVAAARVAVTVASADLRRMTSR